MIRYDNMKPTNKSAASKMWVEMWMKKILHSEYLFNIDAEQTKDGKTSLENIYTQIKEVQPTIVVIDSIQTISSEYVESSAGSLTQVRECAASLLKFAKESGTPVLLIGHITKDGTIAGPKILEHIVDAVLQFEGDQHYLYRILRPIKNRFGSTSELGIYEMRENGLRQVSNTSELLLTHSHQGMSGV